MKCGAGGGKRSYFEGWYWKHQSRTGEIAAFIPARHIDLKGRSGASLQVITPTGADTAEYRSDAFSAEQKPLTVNIGENQFSTQGIKVDIETDRLSVRGFLRYGPMTPLQSDIMGPFRFIPGLQCRHSVVSMGHRLAGRLLINGVDIDFTGGTGYIEGDRGSSFPQSYLWVQCAWRAERCNSVMLSIADIPMLCGHFTGCICAVLYGGREYRLSTYQGVRIEEWSSQGAVLRQEKLRLAIELKPGDCHPLQAPQRGKMVRTIQENIRTTAHIRFWVGKELVFDHIDQMASFEYVGGSDCVRTTLTESWGEYGD